MSVETGSNTETIHVLLEDEAVPVWRPVLAHRIGAFVFEILPQAIPADEVWQFLPGAFVHVETRQGEGQPYLFAVARAPAPVG